MTRLDASAYQIPIDAHSCFAIGSGGRNRGYLCGAVGNRVDTSERPVPQLGYFPEIVKESKVLFSAARADQKTHRRPL